MVVVTITAAKEEVRSGSLKTERLNKQRSFKQETAAHVQYET